MELLSDGLLLLIIGMGTVVTFLVLTIGWIHFSCAVLRRIERLLPELPGKESAPAKASAVRAPAEDDSGLVAAITAAVNTYRNRRMH